VVGMENGYVWVFPKVEGAAAQAVTLDHRTEVDAADATVVL
jgi:hypothetical protein